MSGILDATGAPASGNGSFSANARVTFDDRANGDMTVIYFFPGPLTFPLTGGKAKHKTSANAILNNLGPLGLPLCASLEFLNMQIRDVNGNPFAAGGLFISDN